MSVNNIFM